MFKRKLQLINYQGATLIELMITLTISIILLSLLSVIYLATENQNIFIATLNTVNENSRFALQKLSHELKMAGFIGCPTLRPDLLLNNATAYPLNSSNIVELNQDAIGSTRLTVRHRSARADTLAQPMTEPSRLELSAHFQIENEAVLVISDCRHADIFQAKQVTQQAGGQRIVSFTPLRYRYSQGAEIGLLEVNTYWIEKNALYQLDLSGNKSELVEGIQRLKAEFIKPDESSGRRGVLIELEIQQRKLKKSAYAFVALKA